jgi:hypothetical protein
MLVYLTDFISSPNFCRYLFLLLLLSNNNPSSFAPVTPTTTTMPDLQQQIQSMIQTVFLQLQAKQAEQQQQQQQQAMAGILLQQLLLAGGVGGGSGNHWSPPPSPPPPSLLSWGSSIPTALPVVAAPPVPVNTISRQVEGAADFLNFLTCVQKGCQ